MTYAPRQEGPAHCYSRFDLLRTIGNLDDIDKACFGQNVYTVISKSYISGLVFEIADEE
jgi:hypothetical protein